MVKRKDEAPPRRRAKLLVGREEGRAKIEAQRSIGAALATGAVTGRGDVKGFANEVTTWREVTSHILETLFDTDDEAERFSARVRIAFAMGDDPATRLRERREDAAAYVRRLDSLLQRLDLFEEAQTPTSAIPATRGSPDAVFVVHGHDLAAKQETARLLERLRFRAVILDEQTNKGRTIIEKFEDHAGECGFAVVLLTPDDLGRARNDGAERPRARQNVLFELGYFMAKLGRGKVCALHKGGLDLPSDIQGVIWVSFDDGAWKLALAKEMRDAGMPVDLNLL